MAKQRTGSGAGDGGGAGAVTINGKAARRDTPAEATAPTVAEVTARVEATAAPVAVAAAGPASAPDCGGVVAALARAEPARTPVPPSPPLPPPAPRAAGPGAGPRETTVHVAVICGGFTNVKVPVAVCPRYQGMALAGPAKAFDRQMDSWLTRAADLGMIGSGLGQLFPVNLQRGHDAGRFKVEALLLVGMGDPGQFAPDDLRYLMSNVTVAVKSMRQDHLSTMLIGTRRNEMTVGQAVRGLLEGILDGYDRFRVIAESVTFEADSYRALADRPLFVSLVETDRKQADDILKAFEDVARDRSIPGLELEVERGEDVEPDTQADPRAVDVDPYVPLTLLRVTANTTISAPPPVVAPASPAPFGMAAISVFEYSGISEVAAVTVRERELNAYLVREFPDRMTGATSPEEQEEIGMFFTDYLVPDEFRKLAEGGTDLTIEVDETTAAFPWEMAAHKKYSRTSFLGTTVSVSRQFRTLTSPPPSSPPPLNRVQNVLIIADPAPDILALPHAREEGLEVVDVLDHAQQAWEGEYEFKVTVRIGSFKNAGDLAPLCRKLRERGGWIVSAEPCDPFELTLLIARQHFDVIHYAGHGSFDGKRRQAGWLFDRNYALSAPEIFSVRQVPRLVFANACFSAVTTNREEERSHNVGLAQAFFARGIPNYIGTGWRVDDACARECARWFYARVLGLRRPTDEHAVYGTSPPATIGEALREARRDVHDFRPDSTSWGAYQHYGRVTDKLLPFHNARANPRNGSA